jgi:hypothetical protein
MNDIEMLWLCNSIVVFKLALDFLNYFDNEWYEGIRKFMHQVQTTPWRQTIKEIKMIEHSGNVMFDLDF